MSDNPQNTSENHENNDKLLDVPSNDVKQKTTTGNKGGPKRDSKARTASAAVFFNDNKAIAGFGNAMRAVFTSIRELMENSLDASEKRGITPLIVMKMRRLDKAEMDELMGTSLVKTKEKRVDFIELSCRDNGVGVPRILIPQLFGTVLAGTKYGAQQTRGRFGLGSKMVLLHAMSTLDLPIQITTRPYGEDTTYRVQLFINLEKNEPIIHKDWSYKEGDDDYFDDYGTEIKVSFTGSWTQAKNYVREYFKQLAIITPYADIHITLPGDEVGTEDVFEYKRVVDDLPKPPEVVKIHPWGTDISTFRREMAHSDHENLIEFLSQTFMGVSEKAAKGFFEEIGVDSNKKVNELNSQEIRRIVHDGFNRALKESKVEKRKRDRIFKFDPPSGEALSPLGADRLRKGLEKELEPEFIESFTRSPHAYEGHPFVIEAAIGYGGGVTSAAASKAATVVDNKVIYRYANRIPLIFGAGNDLITQQINKINWSEYGLTRASDPLAIAVSLVSTKIPFPETSKEYISSVVEIELEVEKVLKQLGRKLKTFISRRRRRQRERQRKSRFERYAPQTVHNLLAILEKEELWNPITGIKPERVISALASGKPRIGSNFIPMGIKLSEAPIWSTVDVVHKLQNSNIYELSTFLRSPNPDLSRILGWGPLEVDIVKRRTIHELEFRGDIPPLDIDTLLDPEIEKRYYKKKTDEKKKSDKTVEIPRLSKALQRRWIRNVYDYLVSPSDKLKLVQGLFPKLMEQEKFKIIQSAISVDDADLLDDLTDYLGKEGGFIGKIHPVSVETETPLSLDDMFEEDPPKKYKSTSTQLAIEDVIPSLTEMLEFAIVKKRKIKTINELLADIVHPSLPLDKEALSEDLISAFKSKLSELVVWNPEIADIKVSVEGQKWLNKNIINEFNKRKINTVTDLIVDKENSLSDIKHFINTLFSVIESKNIPSKGGIDPQQFNTDNATEKIKLLKKAGIHTIEHFLYTSSEALKNELKLDKYFEFLIEESKDKLIATLTMQNKLGELQLLKIIPNDLEDELNRIDLHYSVEFLATPIDIFDENYQERIIYAKKQIGRGFDGIKQSQKRVLKKLRINVLEELVFNPDHYLDNDLTEKEKNELTNLIKLLMKPVHYMDPHLIPSLDVLHDAGITNLGKFMVWPLDRLAQVLNYQEEWLKLIKENFKISDVSTNEKRLHNKLDTYTHLLGVRNVETAKLLGLSTVEQVAQLKWGDIFPKIDNWENVSNVNKLLTSEVKEFSSSLINPKVAKTFDSTLMDLEKAKINVVLNLLKISPNSIVKITKGKKKQDLLISLFNDFRLEDIEVIDDSTQMYQAIRLYNLVLTLSSPIVYLDSLSTREIDILNTVGIKTLHQLISICNSDFHALFNLPDLSIENKLKNGKLNTIGTPLSIIDENNKIQSILFFEHERVEYFQSEEIVALHDAGFTTIESLYYMSDHRTFEVPGINWNVIAHYKKLLQSPIVLITWRNTHEKTEIDEEAEEEKDRKKIVKYYTYDNFSSKELEILNKANVSNVFDFITYDINEVMKLLDWDIDLTKKRLTSIRLQEAGISLKDLEIFRPNHIDHLSDLGVVTIEDLYFTTTQETWESNIIPWASIKTIKDILHLDVINAVEELGQEMVVLLKESGVDTILDFYLTGAPILEQRTGEPAERFENKKEDLQIGELIKSFDKSILFAPGLTYFQTMTLMKEGYTKIIDIVLSDNKKIAKILGLQTKEIDFLMDSINRVTVERSEEDRGVQLKDLQIFSRAEIRSITKSGIFDINELDTLQEVLFQIDGSFFEGEDYLKKQVLNIKRVCTIPLNKIGDLNEQEVKLLNTNYIINIADVLLVAHDDLAEDNELYAALTNVTRSVIDLRPFMAIAKLSASAAMRGETSDENLLDAWMNDNPKLHSVTMNSLRSLISIPVCLTQFVKYYNDDPALLGDKTVGDIILEYFPDENSPEALLNSEFNKPSALIRLLKEGSTPITLLDITPQEFRALYNNGVSTIERLLTKDPRYLISIAGNTQKFWRNIRDIFIPEEFGIRLQTIGLPFEIFHPTPSQQEILDEYEFEYLDEMLNLDEIPHELQSFTRFLFSSTTFLIGTPGEKELVENDGAQNIIEAVISIRRSKASKELIHETMQIAWKSFQTLAIPFKNKKANEMGIHTIQDLIGHIKQGGSKTKTWLDKIYPFTKSLLVLPLSPSELKELVITHRCSTVIDVFSNPMIFGEVDKLRKAFLEKEKLDTLDVMISVNILKKIDKSIWNRVHEKEMCLQDIVSSPRTINEYHGIRQRFMQQSRQDLKLPLSRIFLGERRILHGMINPIEILTVEDIIYSLPGLYSNNSEIYNEVKQILESDDLSITRGHTLPEHISQACTTTFNTEINDFQALYVTSINASKILKSISRPSTVEIKNYVLTSLKSFAGLKGISDQQKWNLWNLGIMTIADLLLSPVDLSKQSEFTSNQVKQMMEIALSSLDMPYNDNLITVGELSEKLLDVKTNQQDIGFVSIITKNPHPLIQDHINNLPAKLSQILRQPVLSSQFGNDLPLEICKQFLAAGINTIADLIFYPEGLDGVPEGFNRIEQRLDIIAGNVTKTRTMISIDDINLPKKLKKLGIKNSLDLIIKLHQKNAIHLRGMLEILLEYSSFDKDHQKLLQKNGYTTILDILIVSPKILSDIIKIDEAQIVEILMNLDVEDISGSLTSAPLQISELEKLSRNSKELLDSNFIFTLLDLQAPVSQRINKSDQNFLNSLISVLDSSVHCLNALESCSRNDIKSMQVDGMLTVRQAIRFHSRVKSKTLSRKLKTITYEELLSCIEKQRRLSDLDGIVVRDEHKLITNGIFNFEQLLEFEKDDFDRMDLDGEHYVNLCGILNSSVENVVGIEQAVINQAKKQGINTAAEFLSSMEYISIDIAKPIKIKQDLLLSQLFHDPSFAKLSVLGIDGYKSFLKLKKTKKLVNTDPLVKEVCATLNLSIRRMTKIKASWVNAMEADGIFRIHQYLSSDLQYLAELCEVSYVSQENYLYKTDLSKLLAEQPCDEIPYLDEDRDMLIKHGITGLDELIKDGLLDNLLDEGLVELINRYKSAYTTPMWQSKQYWQIDEVIRVIFATQGNTCLDLANSRISLMQKPEYKAALSAVIHSFVKQDMTELIELTSWIADGNVIANLENMGITSFQEWIFADYKQPMSLPHNSIFRATLHEVPSLTIKQILRAYNNGITHVSDVITLEDSKISSKIGVSKSKVEGLKETIFNLKPSGATLPELSFFNAEINSRVRESGITSWASILGNIRADELARISGFTDKTRKTFISRLHVPLWHLTMYREKGKTWLSKRSKQGIRQVLDLLVIGSRINTVFDVSGVEQFFNQINVSELNKGMKQAGNLLSQSVKIRVSDQDLYFKKGILSPIDVIVVNHNEGAKSPLQPGIKDWERLGNLDIDVLEFPDVVIANFRKNKINTVGDAIIATNEQLRNYGATNRQLKLFRSKFARKKQAKKTGTGKPKATVKPTKKTVKVAKKKSSAKMAKTAKKPVKKTSKKTTKKPVKKTSKKATKKPVKKTSKKATKKPVKKTSKKATKKSRKQSGGKRK